jgi:beta-glucosidase
VEGAPVITRIDKNIDFNWGQTSPDKKIKVDRFSARWTGKLVAPKTGRIKIGVNSNDGSYLYINNRLVVNNWGMHGPLLRTTEIDIVKGKTYDIKIEYNEVGNNSKVALKWELDIKEPEYDKKAVALAKKADVAIVFAGLSPLWEGEGFDRESMDLPGAQNALIKEVSKVNKNTIVIINSGTPVSMSEWIDQVPAIIQAWYLGQETGNAIADVLFGDYNPSGKLPVTFPEYYSDNPAFNSYKKEKDKAVFEEGLYVGYRYYDSKDVKPLFPFGHGLSYTTFEYSNAKIVQNNDGIIDINLSVKNTGKISGSEVVQLYIHDISSSVERPFKELKGFAKISLEPGESKNITLQLDKRAFSFYGVETKKWITEPGEFEMLIGSSSRDIKLKEKFELK